MGTRAIALILALAGMAAAQESEPGARTPARAGELVLRDHRVRVDLTDGFARTAVEQVLVNPSERLLEARWSFPLPKQASLSDLSVWIDGQRQVGEVVRKDRAREIYDQEQDQGHQSGRAEQTSFKHFDLSLARVPPHAEVKVAIVYFQPVEIDAGVGRYLYPLEHGHTEEPMDTAFWTMAEHASGRFEIDVDLRASYSIDELHCPSHAAFRDARQEDGHWTGSLTERDVDLDRDFVLLWRLAPDAPARIEVLTHRPAGAAEGTFMAVVTPGEDLAPITSGTDWLFLLDTSGSMEGEKIRMLARGTEMALSQLGPGDRARVVVFSDRAHPLGSGWAEPGSPRLAQLIESIRGLSASGSTNVHAGLREAYRLLDGDRPAGVVLVSDGVVTAGPREVRAFIELAETHDVRLFTFVMGNSANERLLGDLATVSGGFAKSVSMRDEIGAHLLLARDRMSHEALHGVEFELEGAVDVHPRRLPSLYLGQQLVVLGRYEGSGPRTLEVRARLSGQPVAWTVPLVLPEEDDANPELERLWALAAIADLEREAWLATGDEREAEAAVTDLALRYSLVTDYTSMVVVAADRKEGYGLGDDNERRRASEDAALQRRRQEGPRVTTITEGEPLAGPRAANAPARAARRSDGGGGAGAVGPLALLPAAALLALRRRRRGART